MAVQIQIHPLDLQEDVAIGIDLPMMVGEGAGFELNYTTLKQAAANSINLLLTNKGERIMLPTFGCDLGKDLFETVSLGNAAIIKRRVVSNFKTWLPYVFINQLEVLAFPDQRKYGLNMIISLERNQFDTMSIQLAITE